MRLTVLLVGENPEDVETIYTGDSATEMGDALAQYLDANTPTTYARKVKRWWSSSGLPSVEQGLEPELRVANGTGVDVWKVWQSNG
jgi:hypothetical protein